VLSARIAVGSETVGFDRLRIGSLVQVKMALGERLAGSKRFPEVCAWAAAAHAGRAETRLGARLRLRDRRGRGASEVGKLLRDGVALERAIPRIADGKEVSVELLSEDEEIGPASEHMIVEVVASHLPLRCPATFLTLR